MFWKRKRKEEVEETPLDKLSSKLAPSGFEEYKTSGRVDEWKNRVLNPAMSAAYKRLYEEDRRFYGQYTIDEVINKIVRPTVETWRDLLKRKLVIIQEESPNCKIHPLLVCGLGIVPREVGEYKIEIRRSDYMGGFPLLGIEIDKKPRANEFYIAVNREVALIGLAISEGEIKDDKARCDYRLALVERVKAPLEVLPENMKMKIS